MRIAGAGHAFPANFHTQEELLAAAKDQWGDQLFNLDRLEQMFSNVLVEGRHLALPLAEYARLESFGQANDAWIEVALETGGEAIRKAVANAGLELSDIDALFTVSVTGVATPSLDARLVNKLGLSTNIKRTPIFGLGCVAGAAGIARAADYVRAYPEETAVLLSVELCSLTLQREDLSIANLISSGLFGDGAAAVVIRGDGTQQPTSPQPAVLATKSIFYPDTEEVMGWRISEKGFQIVLSAEVPEMVRRHLAQDVGEFLAAQDLQKEDIAVWMAHTGGPKVLEAMQEELGVSPKALERTWESLRRVGNLSSTSVLLVLEETMEDPLEAGSYGLLFAMGPGFCSELVLLRWE